MRPEDRQIKIIDLARDQGAVTVDGLAAQFKVSAETIRRDLSRLADAGKIQKVHGGAMLPRISAEGSFRQRMGENVAAKRSIARAAASLVSAGDTLFIDTGSTTVAFAEEIARLNGLTVITNSSEIAALLSTPEHAHRVFLLGGEYNSDNRQTYGSLALAQLANFRAQQAFITIGALDATGGVTDYNFEEAQLARAMIDQSTNLVILADASKFNRSASFKVCDLTTVGCLVCESPPGDALSKALAAHQVEVICSG